MKTLDVVQGSANWLEVRAQHDCASDAPAAMAASKYVKRNELLHMRATGGEREFSEWAQRNLLDKGHEAEAAIRPHIEALIGDELYPATGVEGGLLSSFDGITMAEDTIFEHKLWSEDLAAQVRAKNLEPHYYWQLEHQLATATRAKRVIFVTSDGTPEKCEHMIYTPVTGRRKQLLDGWAQFHADLATFKPQAAAVPVMATVTEALPAVSVRMDGAIAVISNLDVFGDRLTAFIEGIDKNPSTDQAFADAEAAVKTLEKAEDALKQAEAAALAQTASIDDMRRTVGRYGELARTTRLMLEKIVKARKEQIRIEIQQGAQQAFTEHCDVINKRLGKVRIPNITPNFVGVMKGKKTITSLRSAVDDELAKAKIDANAWGEKIDANLRSLRELAGDHAFLFHDAQQIVLKENDDLVALIKNRIAEHKAAEEQRLERERERIREEERIRAQNEERERAGIAEQDRVRVQREQEAAQLQPEPVKAQTVTAPQAMPDIPRQAPAPSAARIKLGDINARIAPLAISAEGLASLGFQSVGTAGAAKLYAESDFPEICMKLAARLTNAANTSMAKAA